jgi:hypothetical protein
MSSNQSRSRPTIITLSDSPQQRSLNRRHFVGRPLLIRTGSLRTKVSVAGKRNFEGRDKGTKTASKVQGCRRRDKDSLNNPANSGLIAESREISGTSNQAVMGELAFAFRKAPVGRGSSLIDTKGTLSKMLGPLTFYLERIVITKGGSLWW